MSPVSPREGPLRVGSLLAHLVRDGSDGSISLGEVLQRFHSRAHGVLLMLVLLPAFIPLPIGAGAISGPLVCLVGLQMLLARPAPWLPEMLRRRRIQRHNLKRFAQRMQRLLGWLERVCKPRLTTLTEHLGVHVFTGAQILLLGILLSLPIPLTNYPFGLLLLLYAFALIERDGALLLVAWGLGLATLITSAFLSTEVLALLQGMMDWFSR